MKSLIIADHHVLVRDALLGLMSTRRDMQVLGVAGNIDELAQGLRQQPVDCVLVDLNLPPSGGLEAVRRVLRVQPDVGVIAIGLSTQSPYPARLMEVGVRGLVSKRSSSSALFTAIERVTSGASYLASDIAECLVRGGIRGPLSPVDALSPRELAVMVMVSNGHLPQEISHRLCISPKTVSTYRSRLCRKLGVRTDVELTHFCLQHGLIEASYCS